MTALSNVIDQASHRWKDVASLEEATLLRLAILRDVLRAMHAEKSVLLARGDRDGAKAFQPQEKRLESLRAASHFPATLEEALQNDTPPKRRTRLLPDALYSVIEREKLERYDRTWEHALAGEAVHLGWRFWALRAWVTIAGAEAFHRALPERLHPHGVVLFAESVPTPDAPPELWRGQWIVALKPRYLTPDFKVRELPSVAPNQPAPEWKLLFSPKPR